jgi:hypothetical protein
MKSSGIIAIGGEDCRCQQYFRKHGGITSAFAKWSRERLSIVVYIFFG